MLLPAVREPEPASGAPEPLVLAGGLGAIGEEPGDSLDFPSFGDIAGSRSRARPRPRPADPGTPGPAEAEERQW